MQTGNKENKSMSEESKVFHTPDGEMPDVPDKKGQTTRPEDPVQQFDQEQRKKEDQKKAG